MRVAADNLSGAHPALARALRELDPKPFQDLARRCQAAGAELLDLNPGYLPRRYEDRLAFLVEAVQEVTRLPLILDSPQPRLLARALPACRETPILNALTLEEEKLQELLPLARNYKTPLVLLLLDARSFSPPSLEEKIALALELREHALAAGLKDQELIYDPVLPNLSWPDACARLGEAVKTVRALAEGTILGEPAATMAGLSNLRSGLRRQYPVDIDTTALALLAGAGLHLILADVLQPRIMETFRLVKTMI
jgi:5-methyltetrahydrofolate corrinoid/iron sulfur protein methyltransferase